MSDSVINIEQLREALNCLNGAETDKRMRSARDFGAMEAWLMAALNGHSDLIIERIHELLEARL